MNAYTHNGRYISLHGYTARPYYFGIKGMSQYEIHRECYKWVHRHFSSDRMKRRIKLEPAKLFLLEAADPKTIPTKDEFEEWMRKREIMKALE